MQEIRLPNWLRPAGAEKMNFLIATVNQNPEEKNGLDFDDFLNAIAEVLL